MSTLTPPEDQPIKARSKSITPSQPQNTTQLLGKTLNDILQVSSPPKSKLMIDLSTLRPETTAENNNTNPHSLIVMQLNNKYEDKDGRMDSQKSLNKAGAIIVRDFGSQESLDDLRKAKNKITKRKVRFADSGYFDGSRDGEESMFDCEVDL
ncbi:hypothetical protein BOTCAL_0243g00050 [Botryotinia calthae]|uniref:Uncharacterized protein n=1 Tax=Botryotinia calthae TaxID=38488 RepID=A0A4Y8CXJ5_9HELO|nr:hypothetical protein BOTCAL_0243g00050 [Botryotinia calthae]